MFYMVHCLSFGFDLNFVFLFDERYVLLGNAPLAQLVEQLTLNQWVPGSNP